MPLVIGLDLKNARAVEKLLNEVPAQVNAASVRSVIKTLDVIEAEQIKAYTSSSNPPQPSGSEYVRTFDLQRSSKTRKPKNVRNRKSVVEGQWWSEGVDYAQLVLGTKSQQASIHAGRWKSLEDVAETADKALSKFMGEELQKIRGVS